MTVAVGEILTGICGIVKIFRKNLTLIDKRRCHGLWNFARPEYNLFWGETMIYTITKLSRDKRGPAYVCQNDN